MLSLGFEILGASFFATDHASAEHALAGAERPFTAPAFALLVGRARRFTSLVTQLHLEVLGALGPRAAGADLQAVFATCHGEIQTAHRLISELRDAGVVSSAQFAQSVHNTPSGLYSVATGSAAPTTTVTGANAIAAGWLEATLIARATGRPVLLSIADEPVPAALLGPSAPGVAAAFLVGPPAARPGAGRPALLTLDEAGGEPERPVRLLARAVQAVTRGQADDLTLGWILAGSALALTFAPAQAAS